MTLRLRLVRNVPIEKWLLGHPEPFAPRFDVEEVDDARIPIRTHATGATAEQARAVIAKLNGEIIA